MSEKKKEDAPKVETKAQKTLEELALENEMLVEQLKLAEAKAAGAEAAAAAAKKAEKTGDKVARALLPVLGEGRRVVAKGEPLSEKELVGLVEGEHFELA